MELIAVFVMIGALLFLAPILGVLFGAFAGWVLGLVGFEGVIMHALNGFGVNTEALSLWQVGAALGFVGGFFKSTLSTKKAD